MCFEEKRDNEQDKCLFDALDNVCLGMVGGGGW